MKYCENCGTRYGCKACPNCFEELYINDYQMPEFPCETSDEWKQKVSEQRKEAERLERVNGDKE